MNGKMQESWLTEIIPFVCILAIWGQGPASFHISLSPSVLARKPATQRPLDSRRCFSWVFSGLRNSYLEGWNSWWLWHPCLLIWQEILHSTLGVSYKIWNCDKSKSILSFYFTFYFPKCISFKIALFAHVALKREKKEWVFCYYYYFP